MQSEIMPSRPNGRLFDNTHNVGTCHICMTGLVVLCIEANTASIFLALGSCNGSVCLVVVIKVSNFYRSESIPL